MSEKLEEKYKYMCELVEQQMKSLLQAGKIIDENEKLKDYIDNMCGMIEMEVNPAEHDRWLEKMVAEGYYNNDGSKNE